MLPARDDAAQALRAFGDHERFCAATLVIRNKEGVEVPLCLTPAQRKLNKYIRRQEDKGLPVRIIVLKSRQVHMSVGTAAEIWKRVAFLEGQTATVYAHEEKSTNALYDYYWQFITKYNANAYIGLKQLPVIKAQTGKSIVFEGGGSIQFGTAGSTSGGRSKPNRYLHNSECALWPDAVTLRTGLLSSVPLTEGTVVIDESTARGYGGPFHAQWQRAMDPDNKSGWLALFFAWWEHPENRKRVQDPHNFRLTDVEHRIMERYALDIEQVNWRREKIDQAERIYRNTKEALNEKG